MKRENTSKITNKKVEMIFNDYKKTFAGLGVLLILIPAVFFAVPKKAEAVVPVIDVAAIAALKVAITGQTASLITSDNSLFGVAAIPGTAGDHLRQLRLKEVGVIPVPFVPNISWDGMAYAAAQLTLHAFSQSIIEWIKTGFQDGPLFITNLQNHLTDAADQATGMFMKQFLSNEVLGSICSPWQNQLKLALSNLAYKSQSKRYSCTLNTVIGNATNFYNNFNQGGWGAWVTVAGSNSNSPYELYLTAQSQLLSAVGAGQSRATTESIFNNGFLSMKKCAPGAMYYDEWTGAQGVCTKYETTSPGKWVQTQLSEATGIDFSRLNFADEINEILMALIGQLISTTLTSQGISEYSAPDLPNTSRQCANGTDDDGDTFVDMDDKGCKNAHDNDESDDTPSNLAQCANGTDDDDDNWIDMADPGCTNSADNDESDDTLAQCANGIDDDDDDLIDFPEDPGCSEDIDDSESNTPDTPITIPPGTREFDVTDINDANLSLQNGIIFNCAAPTGYAVLNIPYAMQRFSMNLAGNHYIRYADGSSGNTPMYNLKTKLVYVPTGEVMFDSDSGYTINLITDEYKTNVCDPAGINCQVNADSIPAGQYLLSITYAPADQYLCEPSPGNDREEIDFTYLNSASAWVINFEASNQ